MSQVTRILESVDAGEPHSGDELMPLVYDELKRLAAARMADERTGHTLQATDLVHMAWMRLVGKDGEAIRWNGRRHFFGAASLAMRRILIDHARKRRAQKREGGWIRVSFGDHAAPTSVDPARLIDLNDALDKLAEEDPQEAELANMKLFSGLSVQEIAEAFGIGTATVKRRWSYIKARLSRDLKRGVDAG